MYNKNRLTLMHDTFQIEKSLSRKRVAHHGVPFQPNLSHKSTVPQPFTFENRDKSRMAQKKAAIEHYFEEENKVRIILQLEGTKRRNKLDLKKNIHS